MAESAFVTFESVDDVLVAKIVCPSVGERESMVIQEELVSRIDGGQSRVVLEVSDVRMMSSVGLGMLVTIAKHCRQGKGNLAICGFQESLLDLIKLTRLDKVLTIKDDQARAVKAASK